MAPVVFGTTVAAVVPEPMFQAVIVPASESKMNRAGAPLTGNPLVGLNTVPVGAPPAMSTTSGTIIGMLRRTPPVYSVDLSVPLSATHNGVDGPADSPHGLTRLGSVMRATPSMSETRLRFL